MKVPRLHHLLFFVGITCYGQNINLPKVPNTSSIGNYNSINTNQRNYNQQTNYNNNQTLINSQRSFSVYEQDRKQVEIEERRKQQANQLIQEAIQAAENAKRFELPNHEHKEKAKYYKKAFNELIKMDVDSFSLKKAVFITENAFYEEKENYDEFDKIIKQTGSFLREKMQELNYDTNSNLAKNLILFQFFSDTLEIKSKDLKHLPIQYDFNDFWGRKDWSKMFVTKLIRTGKGQCHSLPLLYLMLAKEIDAEAYLSTSPNHFYIKFQDEKKKWYNVELTNHMFTADSFVSQNGYITSEALLNGLYMGELSNKGLMSQIIGDLAMGYTRKFGYDTFAKKMIDKAEKLNPNNIGIIQLNSNYMTIKFEHVAHQLGINPRDKNDLQNIRFYPFAVDLLNQTNALYNKIDDLGHKEMPAEQYESWLSSLKEKKQEQNHNELKKRIKLKVNKIKD